MKIHYQQIKPSLVADKYDKRNEVFNWGNDNCQPQLIDSLFEISVTAKNCRDRGTKAISGAGFSQMGDTKVNSEGQTLNKLLRFAAAEAEAQNNVFLHIGYNANLYISSIKVIPATDCRYGKEDDKKYSGKILVYDNWDKSKGRIMPSKFQVYDVYNPNQKVIREQVAAAGDITQYKGQILHINFNPAKKYGVSKLFTAKEDALTEHNSSVFRYNGAESGFMGVKMVVTKPFNNEDDEKDFKKVLNDTRGAKNAGSVIGIQAQQNSEDLKAEILVEDLTSDYNDKLFEYSDKQAEKNIVKAMVVPLILVSQTDNSLFGSSGELLKEAKIQLWESRENERAEIEEVFTKLMANFEDKKEVVNLEIVNPFENVTAQEVE